MSAVSLFEFNTEQEEFAGKQIKTNGDGYACVFDLIEVATGQSRNSAQKTWLRLKEENSPANSPAWCPSVIPVRFEGLQRVTPGARAAQVVEIVMALPGVKARQFRRKAAKVLVRYLGGDVTLLDEIEENARRTDGPSQFFQAEVIRQHQPNNQIEEDREMKMMEMRLEMKRLDVEEKRFQNAKEMLTMSESFGNDILVKQALRSYATNFFNRGGESSSSSSSMETYVDIPQILKELNIPQKESAKHGKMVAKRYREHFGKEPEKSMKVVNGSQRMCNVYSMYEVQTIKSWF